MRSFLLLLATCAAITTAAAADHLQLLTDPNLSPDGKTLLFVHRGDIWQVPTKGGQATRVTYHPAAEQEPHFSPDGKRIAFVSDRTGSRQVFVMKRGDLAPQQLTHHTEGFSLQGWYPDGASLLTLGSRDHYWKYSQRFMKIDAAERSMEQYLFNGYGTAGQISPEGSGTLFVREGERWWRKGYKGARSAQVWHYDLREEKFSKLLDLPTGCFSPVWQPDGEGFYYSGSQKADNGARNLWHYDMQSKKSQQMTHFDDDLVTDPTISADGSTIVFSHLFDLYRWKPKKDAPPQPIKITVSREDLADDIHRRTLKQATDATFSVDGLEVAFISGGDLWVMETELREPVQVTHTSEFESDPIFINDGNTIVCVSWKDGEPDICKIQRKDDSRYWWQNQDFSTTWLTEDAVLESDLQVSPDGKKLAYIRERGDLWIRDLETDEATRLVKSFTALDYDFSPDGQWIVYDKTDDNFNTDIWIAPVDQSSDPVNISRHPDDESGPRWSSDGKLIAFSGRRADDEIDIYYVWLTEEDADTGTRDRKLQKALKAFEKSRETLLKDKPKADSKSEDESDKNKESDGDKAEKPEPKDKLKESAERRIPVVRIDFKDIHRRLKRISNANAGEKVLGWSPDGKKLIFSGSVGGAAGTYSVEFPDKLTPKKITKDTGSIKGWLKSPDRMLWLSSGIPGVQPLSGDAKKYSFNARQELSRTARLQAGFDTAWRIMRDWWYDDNYGNHNWNQIRRKYGAAAAAAVDMNSLARVIQLMLGELNGSHLGFYAGESLTPELEGGDDWRPTTSHLGVRFDRKFKGPGLKVKDVIPEGPATDDGSKIEPGEIILAIDGTAVDPAFDLTRVLNGPLDRDIALKVKSAGKNGETRDVTLRPTSYSRVRSLLYLKWQDDNRKLVAKKADNIGYLHIQGMNWTSFLDFERELYDVGYGKDGIIIDVRDNGGGSTTDHLLTALTQPQHAITIPRGGGTGYPQSRMVYATWNKPIVVMCNQNSYSNAEIFSHAIKNLGRGKLVGVPTAGGVISTGIRRVMDVGAIRLPFRGWYVKATGEDMELNGAVPDVIVWPKPTEIPSGKDRQLNRAVKVLQQEIEDWKAEERPPLIRATERAKK